MNTRRRGSVVTDRNTECPTSFDRSGSSEHESNAPLIERSTSDRCFDVFEYRALINFQSYLGIVSACEERTINLPIIKH
tara:strand:+ start:17 stop:253 length:237 start_codon:yes stop_codon:yes gene_type:complete